MADMEDLPAPGPSSSSDGAEVPAQPTSGPAGFPVGGMHPDQGPTAPIPATRDPSDPLSPEKLRETELTVEQAVASYNRLAAVAREPGSEPGYNQVIASLVHYQTLYRHLNSQAEVEYHQSVATRDLTAKLDMSHLPNIEAHADATKAAAAAFLTWEQVYATYQDIHACLHGADTPVPAAAPRDRHLGTRSG